MCRAAEAPGLLLQAFRGAALKLLASHHLSIAFKNAFEHLEGRLVAAVTQLLVSRSALHFIPHQFSDSQIEQCCGMTGRPALAPEGGRGNLSSKSD